VSAGYAYTTISADPGEPARVGVSFYLDGRAWISVNGRDTDRPHLAVSLGEVSVSIAPVPGQATAEAARIARELAENAAVYAAEVERLCTASTATQSGAAAA
jgi:hypothetical protein